MSVRWARPYFAPSAERAFVDLVILTGDKPPLDIDLDDEDGFPRDFQLPEGISVRSAALADHRAAFAEYLEGPFREMASAQLGDAARAIDDARYAVSIQGSLADPPDLAHLQALRAFERFLARTASGIAVANDISLAWQGLGAYASSEPPSRLFIDEWVEILYDEEARGMHTLGMAQFARPDVAIFDQPEHRLERVAQLLRHVAHLEAHGRSFADGAKIEVDGAEVASSERVSVALSRLDAARCKTLAVRADTLVVEGWPAGIV